MLRQSWQLAWLTLLINRQFPKNDQHGETDGEDKNGNEHPPIFLSKFLLHYNRAKASAPSVTGK
jgi:hypothetical protein